MKTFIDTPDDIHPADKIGWVQGYNQCIADHEYMDTHAHLRMLLACSLDVLKAYRSALSMPITPSGVEHAVFKQGLRMIERIEEVLK